MPISTPPLQLHDMPRDRTPFVCFLTDSETNNSLCLRYWSIDDSGKWTEPYAALQSDAGLSRAEMIKMLKSACRAYLPHLRCNACGTAILRPAGAPMLFSANAVAYMLTLIEGAETWVKDLATRREPE